MAEAKLPNERIVPVRALGTFMIVTKLGSVTGVRLLSAQ